MNELRAIASASKVSSIKEPVQQDVFARGFRRALLTKIKDRQWRYSCGWANDVQLRTECGTVATKRRALTAIGSWLEDA